MGRRALQATLLLAIGALLVTGLGDGCAGVGSSRPTAAAPSPTAAPPTHRPPAVAGAFYPAAAAELRSQIAQCLAAAKPPSLSGEPVALIVPHAGYSYSAGVAAWAYKALAHQHFDTVIVVGPSHHVAFPGVAFSTAAYWDTPLGAVPIDRDACEALKKADPQVRPLDEAHAPEHSVEVQVPFLQTVLRDFSLVPLIMVDYSQSNCTALAKALASFARGRSVLLVASSDMSHYPTYADAARVDKETLRAIESFDAGKVAATSRKQLAAGTPGLETCLCGEGPVEAVMMAARLLGANRVQVLHYANSGDIPGADRTHVVGYGAVALTRPAKPAAPQARAASFELTPAQQRRLLSLARDAVRDYTLTGKLPDVRETDPVLLRRTAVFVTLTERGELRGCIGSLEPDAPLFQAVREKAVAACSQDPRFPPVTAKELGSLAVEVSVLSPLRDVKSADEIQLGTHGVVVSSGFRRGVFLPQVADETGWSRDEFLSHLCAEKAGLAPEAWRHGARLSVFTVQAFHSPAPTEVSH